MCGRSGSCSGLTSRMGTGTASGRGRRVVGQSTGRFSRLGAAGGIYSISVRLWPWAIRVGDSVVFSVMSSATAMIIWFPPWEYTISRRSPQLPFGLINFKMQ